ncbi:FMN-binding protein MioC [Aeromonas sanarellii]|uniref:FMN-binding protein MioC n=1 Tax=Aeromonas sanarellii TaxID=633415 RepID=UPI0005A67DE5|nr:FMN-binding protein MioC [Aeromonas sanarellii]
MAKLNLVVGSMLGASEYVADHVASLLEQAGHQAEIHNPASLAEILAEPKAILLVITSTHGAGDVPDNLQPFAKDLVDQRPDLSALKYGVIALGDRSYDTFCQGGKTLDRLLAECGASRIGDRLEIDVTQHEIPEDAAEAWIHDWMASIA